MMSRTEAGFTMIEMMVSLLIALVCLTGLAQMTVESSKLNRGQQMAAQVQQNARNCLEMVVQRIRSAGWDPINAGVGNVNWDSNLSDDVSEIEILADFDEDGATTGLDEQVLIRHVNNQVVWRRTGDTSDPFIVLATNITNDADGDGTPEPMFTQQSSGLGADRVRVQITARSPMPDPTTGEYIQYTVRSDVALRKTL